jgi:hypothetical protein
VDLWETRHCDDAGAVGRPRSYLALGLGRVIARLALACGLRREDAELRQCSGMTPDPHRGSKRLRESGAVDLAEELAANLNRVVPEDVALAALPGGTIRIMAGEGGGWREVSRWPQEAPASVALNVLYALQDEIIENSTHTGWPPVDPSRPELAQPAPNSLTRPPRSSTRRCCCGTATRTTWRWRCRRSQSGPSTLAWASVRDP